MGVPNYIGRFAPSPSGPLHLGSLVAALASYLDARIHSGKWLLRIEDLDPPRELPGADRTIIDCLTAHGMLPDEEPLYQSSRLDAYQFALDQLIVSQDVYHCPCNRQWLKAHPGQHTHACLNQDFPKQEPTALRYRGKGLTYPWKDPIMGEQAGFIDEDFILKRKDGLFAYQLAVVVDDIYQGVTHVVRGNDLAPSTAMQLALYQALESTEPTFIHIPVITNTDGQKLSKQHGASGLDNAQARQNLHDAGEALGLPQPDRGCTTKEILDLFTEHWQPHRLIGKVAILAP